MEQLKMCCSAHIVVLLTSMLLGCGNKGPLVRPVPLEQQAPTAEAAEPDTEIEQKEPKK